MFELISSRGLGNPTALLSPDTGTTTFTHDAAGRETSRSDARGQLTTTAYDALDRPTLLTHADGSRIAYLWDAGTGALGRLSGITRQDSAGAVQDAIDFAWDAQGRLSGQLNTIGTHTATIAYAWAGGRLSALTLPSGRVLNYIRDANGRINAINLTETTGSRALASNISYRPFGGLTGFVNGANQAMSRQYDGDGRTIAYSLGASPWALQLDAASRIIGQTEQSSQRSGSYDYDALDRITGALLPTASYGYAWDATGNRTERSSGTDSVPYVTEATSNRLTSIGGLFPKTFSYDANGSRTGDGSTSFAYDVRGRLSSVTNAGGTTTYQVNSLGQRVKKTQGGTTTYFHYDQQGHLIAEANGSGTIVREYVWLEDTPVAVLDGAQGNTTVSWLFADHLNTPRLATNDAGTVIWRMDPLVEPFGDALPEQDPDGDQTAFVLNLRFPGQYFDAETGLHYNYFRDYDPATGRYVESDPIGLEGGINTYLYVFGSPLSYTDPTGESPVGICIAAVAAVATAVGGYNLYEALDELGRSAQQHGDNLVQCGQQTNPDVCANANSSEARMYGNAGAAAAEGTGLGRRMPPTRPVAATNVAVPRSQPRYPIIPSDANSGKAFAPGYNRSNR